MRDIDAFRKQPDAQIPDILMLNNDLSLAAVGLYVKIHYLLTKTDIALEKSTLREYCKEGDRAFTRVWKELKDKGYLKVYRIRRSDRRGFCYEYELLSEPDTKKKSLITIGIKGNEINHIDKTNYNNQNIINNTNMLSEKIDNTISEDYNIYYKNNMVSGLEGNRQVFSKSESALEKNMSTLKEMEAYRGVIEFNIEYSDILDNREFNINQEVLDEWITMIIQTIFSKENNFIIDEKKVSKSRVSNMFQKATKYDIVTAIKEFEKDYRTCESDIMRVYLWRVLKKKNK